MRLAEDIDENVAEMDDEDLDDALTEDDLSERRRRRRGSRVRGRGYASPRHDNSPVSQTQMQAALARVAEDVRKLAANQQALDARVSSGLTRLRNDTQQSSQMAALLPLLFKPKAKTLAELVAAGELTTAKFMIDSNDSMSMMLPLLLMGGMGGSSSTSSGGDNNMMLLAVAMLAMQKK
jgi:hypothetical protein